MERERISVIIPVYKVEKYLEKCVQSVLGQTYEDLEVILVDDGSPDACPAMCDAFAARDGRVRVLHRKNGGLSTARNAGLDMAGGAYVGFVDSDDYVAPDMYEKLYAALTEAGADMSLCGYRYVDEQGRPTRTLPPLPRKVMSPEEIFRQMERPAGEWRYVTAVNRLYRRELFDGLRFREGKLYEDEFLAPHVLARCGAVAVIPDEPYFYVQRDGSIMARPVTIRRMDAVQAYVERYDFYRARGLDGLAASALRTAYGLVWEVVANVNVWEHRGTVWPWVGRVAGAQLRRLDPRAAMLTFRYAWGLLRGLAAGRTEDGE